MKEFKMHTRLKEIRTKLKLQQGIFAEKLGIHQQQYYTYESGKSRPSVEILNKLIEKYEISIDWLLTGRGQMFLNQEPDNVMTIELNAGQELRVVRRD